MPPPREDAYIEGGMAELSENKYAFTLAETLITIGIIGIVAALTLPSLVAKYDEMVMVNKLKRTYAELANAIELRKAELGTDSYADQFNPEYSSMEQLEGFTKYLNVIEKCSSSENKNGCGGIYKVKQKNKTNDGYGNVSKGISVGSDRVILNDGTLIWFGKRNWTGNCEVTYTKYEKDENGNFTNIVDGKPVPQYYTAQHCAEIFFDINGPRKGRNQFGYDCYSFAVAPTKLNQHTGYGGLYDTIRTGKLTYEKYSEGKY